jgi:ABC-type branched-subunit amino acid transport system substrate-binding protein
MTTRKLVHVAVCLAALLGSAARAQISDNVVRIGVLTDETGPYADSAGPGSVLAARMAVEDFGGTVCGKSVEIVHADTQNKPDVASTVACRWFDADGVDAVVDLPVTPIGLALQEIAKQKNRTVQGYMFTEGFYWDQSDASRAFARQFFAVQKMMPSKNHADIYTAVTHYLHAAETAGTDEAVAVNHAMRERPLDHFGKPATVRSDGRVLYDVTLWRVKAPSECREPWDYYTPVQTIPAAEAFLPINKDACGG